MSTIGSRIRWARLQAGSGLREFDRYCGLSEGHTRAIESNGRTSIDTCTAAKVADTLGVSLDWLVKGAGATPKREALRAAVEASRIRYFAANPPKAKAA